MNSIKQYQIIPRSKPVKQNQIIPWLFLAPSLIGVLWFNGVAFLDVVKRSFQDAMGKQFVGLENYCLVLENPPFHLAAKNMVRFLFICIPLLMALSFSIALLLSADAENREKISPAGRKARKGSVSWFRTTLVLPMAVPAVSMVLVWKILFCPEGVLNQIISRLSGQNWETDWAYSSWAFPVLTATYLWKHTGYDMILWLAGLGGIPRELYEAAKMDGAGAAARLHYITLPHMKGSFELVGILSLVNAFYVYREAYLLAGSYPDSSIYLLPHLFAHWFLQMDVQKMTAAAVMLVTAFFILALAMRGIKYIYTLSKNTFQIRNPPC